MKAYNVTFDAMLTAFLEIQADSEEHAEEIAEQMLNDGKVQFQRAHKSEEISHIEEAQ